LRAVKKKIVARAREKAIVGQAMLWTMSGDPLPIACKISVKAGSEA
jgi:hypothetical protein